jgi:hypothetical protein
MSDIYLYCYEKIIKKITSNYDEYLEGEEIFIKKFLKKIIIKKYNINDNYNIYINDIYSNIIFEINETITDFEYNFN